MTKTAVVLAVLASGLARADVKDSGPGFFVVKQTKSMAAPAAKVWQSLLKIGEWWSPQHTFSGDAKNLSLDAQAPGCFCEKLPGDGSVRHLAVKAVFPRRLLVLEGGLGPLQQSGVAGALSFQLAEKDGQTELTLTYDVAGHFEGGLSALAPKVDEVLTEAVARLAAYVETGKPDTAAKPKNRPAK
jgi:hypothetical protein